MHMTVSSICGFHGMTNCCGYMAMSRYISKNIASHNLIYPQYILYPNLFFAILYFRYIPLYSYCILIKFVHHSHYIPSIQVHSEIIRICSQLYPMAYIQHIYFLNYIRWHIFHLSSQLHIYIYISHDIHSASLLNYIPWHIFDILSQLYPMTHIRHIVSIISNDVYSTFHISSQLYSMTHTHIITYIYIYIYRQTYSYDIPWFHVNIPPSKWTKANSQVMQIPLVLVALSQEEQARQLRHFCSGWEVHGGSPPKRCRLQYVTTRTLVTNSRLKIEHLAQKASYSDFFWLRRNPNLWIMAVTMRHIRVLYLNTIMTLGI